MLQLKVKQFRAHFFKMAFHSFKEINCTNGDCAKCEDHGMEDIVELGFGTHLYCRSLEVILEPWVVVQRVLELKLKVNVPVLINLLNSNFE